MNRRPQNPGPRINQRSWSKQSESTAKPVRLAARSWRPSWPILGLASLLVLVLSAPLVLQYLGRAPEQEYRATGYTRLINDLVARRGWLAVTYDANGAPRVRPSAYAPANEPRFRAFERYSYLRTDMRTADESIWTFDRDGLLITGISDDAHRIRGPFAENTAWRGNVLFRGANSHTPTIVDAGGAAYVLGLGEAGQTPTVPLFVDAPPDRRLFAPRYSFKLGQTTVAWVFIVGDQVLLRVRENEDVRVTLGRRVLKGRDGAPILEVWRPGQSLAFQQGGRSTRYSLSTNAVALSSYQGGRPRTRFAGLENLALGLEGAMNLDPTAGDVNTTLDPALQIAVQRALDREAERLRAGGRSFPAAVAVLDTLNGEVLALATYPNQRSQLDAGARRSVRLSPLMAHNQNFAPLPIGSVAKAPIAVAILETHPALASLRVQPSQEFRAVLGIDLGVPFDDHARGDADGFIGFERFLEKSSNKYTAALMLLALGQDGAVRGEPSPEPYFVSGRRLTNVPDLYVLRNSQMRPAGLRPEFASSPPDWGLRLASLFDVRVEGDESHIPADAKIWGALSHGRAADFAQVSPRLYPLGLNDVQNVATDYVMTGLGGNRSRWTTVKIAEVFATIVTRRPVRAHLTPTAPVPTAMGPVISDAAWAPTMNGLRAVVKSGTGVRLDTATPQPNIGEVRVFAKTGTPALERPSVPTEQNQALRAYVAQGCPLEYGAEGAMRLPGLTPASTDAELTAALTRLRPICAGSEVRRRLIASELRRLNRLAARNLDDAPVEGTQVRSIPVDAPLVSGAGHVLGLTVGFYPDGATPNDRPQRSLSLAVNLQNRRADNRTPAIDVARALLCDPAVMNWLSDGGDWTKGSGCP